MFRMLIAAGLCLSLLIGGAAAQPVPAATEGDPVMSSGALGARDQPNGASPHGQRSMPAPPAPTNLGRFHVISRYKSVNFDDNAAENNGSLFIPPDPIGAAGNSRIVAVVNSMIESRTKSGVFKWRQGLLDFYAPLSPASKPFDPKIVYDNHEDRFVVVALEQITGAASVSSTNISRILLAVSKTNNPGSASAADWNFYAINSKLVIPRPVTQFDHWADYPGFEVDEEAIYVTANMFTFVPFGSYGGTRLWIIDKGKGSGGFYDGGPAGVTVHNPYATPGSVATTTMPAEIRTAGGAGPGIGTYLVAYSGLTDGVNEFIEVLRVNNPLGATSFTLDFISLGDIENFASFPDAPQLGSAVRLETNDRRALDAVWQDDALWLTATINPRTGPDAGQTTAMWVKIDTSSVTGASDPDGLVFLDQRGEIGGEEIAPGAFTYYPSVAVNRFGSAAFGFSASAPTIYGGAFVAVHAAGDPPGTILPAETVRDGVAPYVRTFGGSRNRWGDYSGICVDPANDDTFWVFNMYAETQGTPTAGPGGPEVGRWGTAWARGKFYPKK